MRRTFGVGLVVVVAVAAGLASAVRLPEARAQRARVEVAWEYMVSVLSYNPGERLTDEQRAEGFAKLLNDQARQGWEPVGSLLSRDTTQTVGGGVTTRQTTSFVAFRRAKK